MDFTAPALAALVAADYPELAIQSANVVDNGWDNVVVEVNGDYIFRFPWDQNATLDTEIAVLRELRGKTTLRVPHIEYVGRTSAFIGYQKLRGTSLAIEAYRALAPAVRDQLVRHVAGFLVEMHMAMPVDRARGLGVVDDDPLARLAEVQRVRGRVDGTVDAFLAAATREYRALLDTPVTPVFLHNDVHVDNMAFDVETQRVNGVFDFGDVAIGDVHREFAPLYPFDASLLEAVIGEYERLTGARISRPRVAVLHHMDLLSDLAVLLEEPEQPACRRQIERIRARAEA